MKTRTRSQISRQNRLGGAKFERDVQKFFRGLGFTVSERQAQARGGVRDGNELTINGQIKVECKRSSAVDVGTKALGDACAQAERDAKGERWVVVWKRPRRHQIMLTYHDNLDNRFTLDTDTAITAYIESVLKKNA